MSRKTTLASSARAGLTLAALVLLVSVAMTAAAQPPRPQVGADPTQPAPGLGSASVKPASSAPLPAASTSAAVTDRSANRDGVGSHKNRVTNLAHLAQRVRKLCTPLSDAEFKEADKRFKEAEKRAKDRIDAENKKKGKANPAPPPPPLDVKRIIGPPAGLCEKLCVAGKDSFCDFDDEAAANAAVIADWPSVRAIAIYARDILRPSVSEAAAAIGLIGTKEREDLGIPKVNDVVEAYNDADGMAEMRESALGAVVAGYSLTAIEQQAAVLGKALAQVIVDRAKREGVGWFMVRLGKDLCRFNEKPSTIPTLEIRTFWLPATCALASQEIDWLQYGSGETQLEALRGAIAADVKGWAAAAGGLALGAAFFSDFSPSQGSVFGCNLAGNANEDQCRSILAVRKAGHDFVADVLRGTNGSTALSNLSSAVTSANRMADGRLISLRFQLAACAASLPSIVTTYRKAVTNSISDPTLAGEALAIGGLARTAACTPIFVGQVPSGAPKGPEMGPRLKAVLRLRGTMGPAIAAFADAIDATQAAFDAYEKVAKESLVAPEVPKVPLPDLSKIADGKSAADVIRATQELVASQARQAQNSLYVRHARAALALAHAALNEADAALGAIESATDPKLVLVEIPGIPDIREHLSRARTTVRDLASGLELAEGLLASDWGAAATRSMAAARRATAKACAANSQCADIVGRLGRHLGVLVAVASDRDPDHLARTIDEAASPPGGWKRKGVDGSTTVSIASFPGVAFGGESRRGQYGVFKERLDKAYFMAPTLAMPVGVDVAWGRSDSTSWLRPDALFVSLIDPLAFLQYDASKDGRLPGPRLTTVLAPGLWLRYRLGDSPFSFSPFVVYRPGFRAWESSWNGPAADALQYGAAFSIDVTLFELGRREPEAN
ncbi:MAG: hypothetical protein HY898_29890 [Deltaproteobacteria bacterium]|nr:hypothetical protein [Deltaproteobacteria bacterium]